MAPHPLRDFTPKLGRSRRSEKPKIDLEEFVDVEKARAYPVPIEKIVDWSNLVRVWQMFLNDRLGDCTVAGMAHAVEVFAAAVGIAINITDEDIERMYEASGWEPSNSEATDQGWTLEDACHYAEKIGLLGTAEKPAPDIVAAVNVRAHNESATQVANELFGGTYVGCEVQEANIQQFQEGRPFQWVPGSPIAGGHCIYEPKLILGADGPMVTWGALQSTTPRWRYEAIDERMALVPCDWEAKLPEAVKELGIVDFAKLDSLLASVT